MTSEPGRFHDNGDNGDNDGDEAPPPNPHGGNPHGGQAQAATEDEG